MQDTLSWLQQRYAPYLEEAYLLITSREKEIARMAREDEERGRQMARLAEELAGNRRELDRRLGLALRVHERLVEHVRTLGQILDLMPLPLSADEREFMQELRGVDADGRLRRKVEGLVQRSSALHREIMAPAARASGLSQQQVGIAAALGGSGVTCGCSMTPGALARREMRRGSGWSGARSCGRFEAPSRSSRRSSLPSCMPRWPSTTSRPGGGSRAPTERRAPCTLPC